MITFKKATEIFSNTELFEKIQEKTSNKRVEMKNLSKSGEHYAFVFRRMPNGFNDVAEVALSKWTTMRAYVVCFNICDEDFLLKLIELCSKGEL